MKRYSKTVLLAVLAMVCHLGHAQGFVNLDFESANLSGYSFGSVPASAAIPGWTAYSGIVALANINLVETGSEVQGPVEIAQSTALQGNYYVSLTWNGNANIHPSISQTGTIPATTQSLIWWGTGGSSFTAVSINGQSLSFSLLSNEGYYGIFGADISAYAGQTGQLVFSSNEPITAGNVWIDNVQFSSSQIPEPSTLGLLALGCSLYLGSIRANLWLKSFARFE